jgi:Ca-activated chloride channel family protein
MEEKAMVTKKMKPLIILIAFLFLILFHSNCWADGLIVTPEFPGAPFPLEIKYHHVTVKINDQTAETTVEQEFYNPTGRRLEGYYLFPIPAGAAIKKFSMFIDGKETPAELLDSAKARQIYEDIVHRKLDPALLEYNGQSAFKVRIFPLEPHAGKKVKLAYWEALNQEGTTFEYLYPLNTEKFSARNLQEITINISLQTGAPLRTIYSPTHPLNIIRRGECQAIADYQAKSIKPDQDFKLYYDTDASKIGLSLLTYRPDLKGSDGYFLMNISPGFSIIPKEAGPKDLTFILDTSGSMAGGKLEQAKRALQYCIHNLNPADRFEIVRFSTESEGLFEQLTAVTPGRIREADDFIADLSATGGTNLERALRQALTGGKSSGRTHLIVLITDGKPTLGETDSDSLLKIIEAENKSEARIFTFGIGTDINTHLLDRITELTRAYRTYIAPQEDLEVTISNFYQKVQSPVLTDLHLDFVGKVKTLQMYPQALPDLFLGSAILSFGRYRGTGAMKVILTGRLGNKPYRLEREVNFPAEDPGHDFIAALWATRRAGYLLDQIRLHGENPELVAEVTELARSYGIITPYTSYLILEDETGRVSRHELDPSLQTLASLPAAEERKDQSQIAYRSMKENSGAGSVKASQELQALNQASNTGDAYQGDGAQEQGGSNPGLTLKYIRGRAFYYIAADRFWVDSKLQTLKTTSKTRIKFASENYFQLLKKEPEIAAFFALGDQVRFEWKGRIYEVYPNSI